MAGLPDIELSDTRPGYSMEELTEQMHDELYWWDARLLADYFFLLKDCRNLVTLLKDPKAEVKEDGNYTLEQYHDLIKSAREMNFNVHRYPAFMSEFARQWSFNKDKKGYFPEDEILYLFYDYAINTCSNDFIRSWYTLNLDINNVLTAMLARRQGWDIGDFVKGEGYVQTLLRENKTADFNLSGELDYIKELMRIVEQDDPVKKEKMIDAFKWVWLDDQTFCEPFGMEALFAYMCKLEMQYRWAGLDVEKGRESFSRIIENLRSEAQVPEEFRRKA